jgi:hypothetical protein
VSLYKLLFLGTDFAKRMLKIKLETSSKESEIRKIIIESSGLTDEELSDANLIVDTSDVLSSDAM